MIAKNEAIPFFSISDPSYSYCVQQTIAAPPPQFNRCRKIKRPDGPKSAHKSPLSALSQLFPNRKAPSTPRPDATPHQPLVPLILLAILACLAAAPARLYAIHPQPTPALGASTHTASGPEPTPFKIVDPNLLEHPLQPRRDLSVTLGGGRGVIIAPHWVMTASHCISPKKEHAIKVIYRDQNGIKRKIKGNLVIRHPTVDIALVRLVRPAPGRDPILILKEPLPPRPIAQSYRLTKLSGDSVWTNIPARVRTKYAGKHLKIAEQDRRGYAGSSGSPWIMHSSRVGDILVGITHGSGIVPQTGTIASWIQSSVSSKSDDTPTWATLDQALDRNHDSPATPQRLRPTPPSTE